MIEHLAIRREEYVGGTTEHPEVRLFIQANRNPLDWLEASLATGQTLWMKWAGGPVVARAKVRAWESGTWSPTTLGDLRARTLGTLLHDKGAFWSSLRARQSGHFVLVQLEDEEWLSRPRFGGLRSYGSSWLIMRSTEERERRLGRAEFPASAGRPGRGGVTLSLRFAVLRRDGFKCKYCGVTSAERRLEVDHVVAVAVGGSNEPQNLVAACTDCNRGKGVTPAA